jgi:pyruvate dehydrogenase E2 component (dihydrolipoamide acetyltransferase)
MEVGTVLKWNVKEGDAVRSGDVLADIETDKATMEMQCFDDGTVAKILVDAGQQVKVGTPIALIAEKGEDVATVAKGTPVAAPTKGATASAPSEQAAAPTPEQAPAPKAAPAPQGRLRASPVARRMAEDEGIDLASLRGSGPGGRIIKRDVVAAATSAAANRESAETAIETARPLGLARVVAPTGGALAGRSVPLSGMRQTIARRLVESKQTIPHYQVTMRFSMDALLAERTKLNEALASAGGGAGIKLSINDFIVRACGLAMAKHPYFNASFAGDRIEVHESVNIGVAISLPEERGGGLVVGTVRDVDRLSLRQISLETKRLAEKARSKGLSIEDMSDATFTISNLGMYGVEHFTAIINPPNSAILACGAAIEQPVVRNGQLAVGWEMQATLSLDHRVIDGAMAAEYLRTLKEYIERPALLVV